MDNLPTGRQIAAARTLIGMAQPELATLSGISAATIKRMEASPATVKGIRNNVLAVQRALETAGVIFVEENGQGPGVRLRKQTGAKPSPQPTAPATKVVKAMDAAIAENRISKTKP